MKDIFVLLGFHAHEPIWDLHQRLLDCIDDPQIKETFPADNWILKRVEAGRDLYRDLLEFSRDLDVPVALEATNEVLEQIAQYAPATFAALAGGYRDGRLAPVYGHAHHTHIGLLTDREVEEEIALNRDFIHGVLGAPQPVRQGLFPSEDALDSAKLRGIEAAGIEYVLFPNLSPRKARYQVCGPQDVTHQPFKIGRRLIALARHFPVSQYIWRPVTRLLPEGVRSQGFLMGQFNVFEEEYRSGRRLSYPITWEQAVADYRAILEEALDAAPDRGMILYMQDLELMDFGDVALRVMKEAWQQVRAARKDITVRFLRPDVYVDEEALPRRRRLARVDFDQISWAPEARLLLRPDGHYPPLDAGPYRGMDAGTEIFARRPFIFWDTGRPLTDICQTLVERLGYGVQIGASAQELHDLNGQRFEELPREQEIAFHLRLIQRACNWGWQPDETRQKWPYLHAWRLFTLLLRDLEAGRRPVRPPVLAEESLAGLERLPEVFIDARAAYLETGLAQQVGRTPYVEDGFGELNRAREQRQAALAALGRARRSNALLAAGGGPAALCSLLAALRDHCTALVLGTDHLQRAWGKAADTDELVMSMYHYLYELYPPLYPQILDELEAAATEADSAEAPEAEAA